MIHSIVVERMGYKLLFVESICNDPKIIQATIKEVKVSSPDYKDVQNDAVLQDFLLRIQVFTRTCLRIYKNVGGGCM